MASREGASRIGRAVVAVCGAIVCAIVALLAWTMLAPAPRPSARHVSPDASADESPRGPPYRGVLLVTSSVGSLRAPRGRLERLVLDGDRVEVERIEHPESSVIHIARCERGGEAIFTASGGPALLERWDRVEGRLERTELWRASFGVSSRMRDFELGVVPILGQGRDLIVVGTHDEGVMALLDPARGATSRVEFDREPRTLVHEVELGDLEGDGVPEIYVTRSPPNTLMPGLVQPGRVVRYVGWPPVTELVMDLAPRHAKEILVADVDRDGRDELYAVVEALIAHEASGPRVVEPVEVRRITTSRPAPGDVIATFDDRLTRFLVVGEPDGDGARSLVAATFSAGLWGLRPGSDPREAWDRELIDARSGGYEHAVTFADLDQDGRDELYVVDDPAGEIRRYTRRDGAWIPEVLVRRGGTEQVITWGITPCPLSAAERVE